MYSPPRATKLIRELKSKRMMAGFAFDLATIDEEDGMPWGFSIPTKREKAWRRFTEQKPYMFIGSPACAPFSTWQRPNEAKANDLEAMRRAKIAPIVHLDFVVRMYREQSEGGRHFPHEHPLYATSWKICSIEKLMNLPQVQLAHGEQRRFGPEARSGPMRGRPIKKPSGSRTNPNEPHDALSKQRAAHNGQRSRPGGGTHIMRSGGVAKKVARYPSRPL